MQADVVERRVDTGRSAFAAVLWLMRGVELRAALGDQVSSHCPVQLPRFTQQPRRQIQLRQGRHDDWYARVAAA